MRRRTLARLWLLALLAVPAGACGGDAPAGPASTSIVGTWDLQTVDGEPLPFVFSESGGDRAEISGNVLTLSADSSFAERFEYRRTVARQRTSGVAWYEGTYSVRERAVAFVYSSNGSTVNGTVSQNGLRLSSAGFAFVYRRR